MAEVDGGRRQERGEVSEDGIPKAESATTWADILTQVEWETLQSFEHRAVMTCLRFVEICSG